jgi:hypothetical protein
VYAEKWVQFYGLLGVPDFYWFDWLKTATDFESLVPHRKGMDFYRASNSSSWGAAVEGAACSGWITPYQKTSIYKSNVQVCKSQTFQSNKSAKNLSNTSEIWPDCTQMVSSGGYQEKDSALICSVDCKSLPSQTWNLSQCHHMNHTEPARSQKPQ